AHLLLIRPGDPPSSTEASSRERRGRVDGPCPSSFGPLDRTAWTPERRSPRSIACRELLGDLAREHRQRDIAMPYELVIFDCDGVLVDSEPIVNRLFVTMLEEVGHALDYEETLREFSGTSSARRLEVCQRRIGFAVPPEFLGLFKKRLSEALERDLRPVPGVRAALDRIDSPRCVASNG